MDTIESQMAIEAIGKWEFWILSLKLYEYMACRKR